MSTLLEFPAPPRSRLSRTLQTNARRRPRLLLWQLPAEGEAQPRRHGLLRLTSSAEWIAWFTWNAAHQRPIPWEGGVSAPLEQLAEIIPSLRAWQLGETSDGAHLLHAAQRYAAEIGDADFPGAVQLFIREEQRHGEYLGRVLDLAEVPRARKNWGDSAFRAFRHCLPSMEVWATPVVMVETHAMIYYRALRDATDSPVLRTVCEQILADEVPHIRFQCQRLAILHRRRAPLLRWLTMGWHRLFFAAITLAVWAGHRRAYRAGGFGFVRFWRASWQRMRHAWRMMNPDAYAWSAERR